MCLNCMTSAEAALMGSAGLATIGSTLLERIRHRFLGRTTEARHATHAANVDFVTSLGLDPDLVLRPPAPERAPRAEGAASAPVVVIPASA